MWLVDTHVYNIFCKHGYACKFSLKTRRYSVKNTPTSAQQKKGRVDLAAKGGEGVQVIGTKKFCELETKVK